MFFMSVITYPLRAEMIDISNWWRWLLVHCALYASVSFPFNSKDGIFSNNQFIQKNIYEKLHRRQYLAISLSIFGFFWFYVMNVWMGLNKSFYEIILISMAVAGSIFLCVNVLRKRE